MAHPDGAVGSCDEDSFQRGPEQKHRDNATCSSGVAGVEVNHKPTRTHLDVHTRMLSSMLYTGGQRIRMRCVRRAQYAAARAVAAARPSATAAMPNVKPKGARTLRVHWSCWRHCTSSPRHRTRNGMERTQARYHLGQEHAVLVEPHCAALLSTRRKSRLSAQPGDCDVHPLSITCVL